MPEFNPLNERFKKQYEDALLHGAHKQRRTADAAWKAINLFERFTGKKNFTSFSIEQTKDFKHWLGKQENEKGELLSLSTVRSTLANVREFFKWLAAHPQCIRKVDGRAVMYLRLSDNDERAARATRERPVPTIAEVRKALQTMPVDTDGQKRDRAIMAFTALTGVRDDALVTLKMKDVDLQRKEVWQNPRYVRTKGRKAISTFFLAFDPIWQEIVVDWIDYARNNLDFQDSDPLFPKDLVANNPKKMTFENAGLSREHWADAATVRDIFKKSFFRAGLPYYHPHSFRKMLVLWALENCSQYQFKAISQNLGHEHAMTTYNSYGTLSRQEQAKAIGSIGQGAADLQGIATENLLLEVGRRSLK